MQVDGSGAIRLGPPLKSHVGGAKLSRPQNFNSQPGTCVTDECLMCISRTNAVSIMGWLILRSHRLAVMARKENESDVWDWCLLVVWIRFLRARSFARFIGFEM